MRAIAILLALLLTAAAPAATAQMGGGGGMRGGYARSFGPGRGPMRGYYPRTPMDFARPDVWWGNQQYEARKGVRRGQMAPLGRVIDGLQRRTPGRQLDTVLGYQGERAVYRVRWITLGGRRIDYVVDAASGVVLGER
ncbi:MAG: PepSY domain-containing protein [Caulobacteraceae bacterium]